ncbi:MAG TPA: hypothetical protein VKT70_15045, partial [Stellaceae bacterium]|nr:hypothetical protein [Stellaceae bacterium]
TTSGGSFSGMVTNAGTILGSLVANDSVSAADTSSSSITSTVSGLSVRVDGGQLRANGGVGLGGSVTSTSLTNSGLITANLIHDATVTSVGTGFVQDRAIAAGVTLTVIGGKAGGFNGSIGGGGFSGTLANSGTIMATAGGTTTVTGSANPQGFTQAFTSAYGIDVFVNGGNHASAAGGSFAGTITNAGLILAAINISTNGTGGNVANYGVAQGLAVSADGSSFNGLGSMVSGSILNSGTIDARASGAGAVGLVARAGGAYEGSGGGVFAAGVTNTGSVSATAQTVAQIPAFATGISVVADGGIAARSKVQVSGGLFTGEVVNRGTIAVTATAMAAARANGMAVFAAGGQASAAGSSAAGGIVAGTIINAGLITVSATGTAPGNAPASAVGILIGVGNPFAAIGGKATPGTMSGSVINSGIVTATASGTNEHAFGILVGTESGGLVPTGVFTGAIVNSGTIMAQGSNGATGAGIKVVTPVQGGITNSGVIIGSEAALDLRQEVGGTTVIHQNGGLIAGSILGAGDTLLQTGGTILLAPGQKISGLGSFNQSGGVLALQMTPTSLPTVSAQAIALHGTVEIVPLPAGGSFASGQTFRDIFTATTPLALAGAKLTSTSSLVGVSLIPDAVTANALDLRLQLTPAPAVEDLTQNLRFGLEEVSVLRDSIEHRLLDGSAYDGGGIATASLSDPGHQVAGGDGVLSDPAAPGGLWARGYGVRGTSSPFEDDRIGLILGGDWHVSPH